jgi:hypothetical protein
VFISANASRSPLPENRVPACARDRFESAPWFFSRRYVEPNVPAASTSRSQVTVTGASRSVSCGTPRRPSTSCTMYVTS